MDFLIDCNPGNIWKWNSDGYKDKIVRKLPSKKASEAHIY